MHVFSVYNQPFGPKPRLPDGIRPPIWANVRFLRVSNLLSTEALLHSVVKMFASLLSGSVRTNQVFITLEAML